MSDLALFLARHDLLTKELNLHTKWLKGKSIQHALRVRAAHACDPEAGLRLLWQCLNRKYGSPEVIEAFLFKYLKEFC